MASLQAVGAQFGTKCQDCMGLTDPPSCATNFNHFIIVYVRMRGNRCHAGTTPRRRCTHICTNAKDKLRPFATNSAFCRGFKPWTVCYFPHHPTAWPHVTSLFMYLTHIPSRFGAISSKKMLPAIIKTVQIEIGLSEYGGNKKAVRTDGLLTKHQN